MDDLCLIRSMCCDSFFHAQGALEMMTGSGLFLRPSMGSWVLYGLGTENHNLPGFVVLGKVDGQRRRDQGVRLGVPAGGVSGRPTCRAWKSRFPTSKPPLPADEQRAQLDVLRRFNERHLRRARRRRRP